MQTNDPRFRSMIANIEKSSTGEMLRNVLAKYDPPSVTNPGFNPVEEIGSSGSNKNVSAIENLGWTGAFVTLNNSHITNVTGGTDPEWFVPPVIGPGDKLIDFDPDYQYIDQDGNPVPV